MGSFSQGTHHSWSHHEGQEKKITSLRAEATRYASFFKDFLTSLNEAKEAGGSVLDHSAITFGCGIRDGNRHDNDNLPLIVAGGGKGALIQGKLIDSGKQQLSSLWMTMLALTGTKKSSFGTGKGESRTPLAGM